MLTTTLEQNKKSYGNEKQHERQHFLQRWTKQMRQLLFTIISIYKLEPRQHRIYIKLKETKKNTKIDEKLLTLKVIAPYKFKR